MTLPGLYPAFPRIGKAGVTLPGLYPAFPRIGKAESLQKANKLQGVSQILIRKNRKLLQLNNGISRISQEIRKGKVKSSMARSLPVENLLTRECAVNYQLLRSNILK